MAGAVAVAGTGVSLGLATGLLPFTATLGVEALLLLALSLILVWRLLRPRPTILALQVAAIPSPPRTIAPTVARVRTEPGTALFLLGAATVVEVSWRVGGLTVADIFFLAAFGWSCYSLLRGRRPERVPTLLIVGVCLFAIGGIAGTIGSVEPGRSAYEVARSVWVLLLWPWTAAMVLRERRHVVIALALWVLSGSVDAIGALGQTTGFSTIAGHLVTNRATGFGSSPNDLGAAMATLLIPALVLALKFRSPSPVGRTARWAALGLVAAALVASGSVSGMGGALIALMLWFVSPTFRGATRTLVIAGLAAAVVLSSLGGVGPSPAHRVQQVFSGRETGPTAGSAQGHLDTISFAWPKIRSHPVIGTGLDNSSLIVHNGLIAAWLGGGIFALVGLLLVFGAALSFGWWAAVAAPNDDDRALAWALVCAVAAFSVFLVNQPLFFNQYGFFASTLLIAWGCRVADARGAGPS